MSQTCRKCNHENPDDMIYCGYCGENLTGYREKVYNQEGPVTDIEWLIMTIQETNNHLKTIKHWIVFFGIVTIIGLIIGFINGLIAGFLSAL